MAIILKHPSYDANILDPRDCYGSDAPILPHGEPAFTPPTDDEWTRLDVHEAIQRLALQVGWRQLSQMVRNLAHFAGEEV